MYVACLYYVVSFVHCMNMITHVQLVNEFCGFHHELCLGELLPCLKRLSEVPANPRDTTFTIQKYQSLAINYMHATKQDYLLRLLQQLTCTNWVTP